MQNLTNYCKQVTSFISGSTNLDNRTLGWGMTFLHESYHTTIGGNLRDSPYTPGPVVDNMNIIRSELNVQGRNYGQRISYGSYSIGKSQYIPFNQAASSQLYIGLPPLPIGKYLKF